MAPNHDRVEGKTSIAPETLEDLPIPVLGKSYPTYALTDCMVRFPTLVLAVFLLIPLVLTVLSMNLSSSIDTSPGAFTIQDHSSAQQLNAVTSALSEWEDALDAHSANARNTRPGIDRASVFTRFFVAYEVDAAAATAYLIKYGIENLSTVTINRYLNLFDASNIGYIRDFEMGILRLPGYETFCFSSRFRAGPTDDNAGLSFPACTPPNSAMTWFYPGEFLNASSRTYWTFSLNNELQTPISSVSNMFYQSSSFRWFVDQSSSADNQISFLLRSQFSLGVPLAVPSSRTEQQIDEFLVKVVDYLDNPPYHPFIRIHYGGDRIVQALASSMASGDITRVFMCLIILFPVLWYYFHSFVLAVLSVVQLALTYPAGFFIFVSAQGEGTKLSLLTALSYLVTLVMAANGMMIIFDTFRQSGFMPTTGRRNLLTVGQRMAYTYRKAGTGISVASIITIVCFLANQSSKVPAVKSFAGMAAVFVGFNWMMLMTYFPAAMLFHHFHISRKRRNLQKQKEVLLERGLRVRDPTFDKFISEVETLNDKHYHACFSHLQSATLTSEAVRRRDKQNATSFFTGQDPNNNNNNNGDGQNNDLSNTRQRGCMDWSVEEMNTRFWATLGVYDIALYFQLSEASAGSKERTSTVRKNYNPDDVAANTMIIENKKIFQKNSNSSPLRKRHDGTLETHEFGNGPGNNNNNNNINVPQSRSFEVDEEQFLNLFADAPDGNNNNNNSSNMDSAAPKSISMNNVDTSINNPHLSQRYKSMWQTALIPDPMRTNLNEVIEIKFINCDEMLAFDDAHLRARLIQLGHNDFANFIFEETDDVAPLCGIFPLNPSKISKDRIHTLVGVALPLLYGKGRTLMSLNLDQLRVAQKNKKKSAEDRKNSTPAPPQQQQQQQQQQKATLNESQLKQREAAQAATGAKAKQESLSSSSSSSSSSDSDSDNNNKNDNNKIPKHKKQKNKKSVEEKNSIYTEDRVIELQDGEGRTVTTIKKKAPPTDEEMKEMENKQQNKKENKHSNNNNDDIHSDSGRNDEQQQQQNQLSQPPAGMPNNNNNNNNSNSPKFPPHGKTPPPVANPPGKRPAAPGMNTVKGMLARAGDWYRGRRDVQREHCCGLLGKRVDEDPQDRQRRILAKTIKHEGYTWWERLFYNEIAEYFNTFRFLGLLLLIGLNILMGTLTSKMEFASAPPPFLGIEPTERYDKIKTVFGESGNCDYCSAYFQPLRSFPTPSVAAIRACVSIFSQPRYFLEVDQCGQCGSANACLDCQGVPSGSSSFDSCGQCLQPTNPLNGKCAFCINSESMPCSFCHSNGAAVTDAGGLCATSCSAQNCIHGTCNPFTGRCDCTRNSVDGYWDSDAGSAIQCSTCMLGWIGTKCTLDCQNSAGLCTCGFGKCLGCEWGYAGENCGTRRTDLCDITGGDPDSVLKVCNCKSGYAGATCRGSANCSGHGFIYNAPDVALALSGQCGCFGQWRGPKCDYCRCYNGGTCLENGTCSCLSGWGGARCQECSTDCKVRGFCAEPYNVSQYSFTQCRALFCTSAELRDNNNVTADCKRCWFYSQNPSCDNTQTFFDGTTNVPRCVASEFCVASGNNQDPNDPTKFYLGCRKNYGASQILNHNCKCRGQWYGSGCSTCNTTPAANARGVTCRESDGVLIGCDGNPQTLGSWTTLDSCNTCGGTSASGLYCKGCDGIVGSDKVVDQCGVCGGYNDCLAGSSGTGTQSSLYGSSSAGSIVKAVSAVYVSFGIRSLDLASKSVVLDTRFDFAAAASQNRLDWVCDQLLAETRIVRASQTRCFVRDFKAWLLSKSLPFPYLGTDFHKQVYQFALEKGRFGEVAFNTLNVNSTVPAIKVDWLLIQVRPVRLYDDDASEYLQSQYNIWMMVQRNLNFAGTNFLGDALVSSSAFVALYSYRAAKLGTIFTTVLGCLLFAVLVLIVTCSPLLAICSLTVLFANVLFVLGIFHSTGWQIGPIEQVSISLLMGVVSERAVHMCESYMEYLHRVHSHWFATEATRLQAIKNTMQRVGVSLSASSITLLVGTCIALAANLYVIKRIAIVVIIIIGSQIIYSLILLPMLFLIAGPVTSTVTPGLMGMFAIIGILMFIAIFVPLVATNTISLI